MGEQTVRTTRHKHRHGPKPEVHRPTDRPSCRWLCPSINCYCRLRRRRNYVASAHAAAAAARLPVQTAPCQNNLKTKRPRKRFKRPLQFSSVRSEIDVCSLSSRRPSRSCCTVNRTIRKKHGLICIKRKITQCFFETEYKVCVWLQ